MNAADRRVRRVCGALLIFCAAAIAVGSLLFPGMGPP
jgi:hypothetical protein